MQILPVARARHAVYIDYDKLIEAPHVQVERLAKALGLRMDPVELDRYRVEFLDQGLRHTVFTLDDLAADPGCALLEDYGL